MKNRVTKASTSTDMASVAHPIWKFLIGAFAGISAIAIPRLGAMLSSAETHGEVAYQFFPLGYLLVGGAVAIVIGIVVAIFEYRVPKRPRETFVTALGIPALLAGVFNTSTGIAVLKETRAESDRIVRSVQQQSEIPKLDVPREVFPVDNGSKPDVSSRFRLENLLGISSAMAADHITVAASAQEAGYAITAVEPRYVVVLEKADSKEAAMVRLQHLSQSVPNVQLIRTEIGFYIIQAGAKTESEATLAALELRKQQLRPSLLRIPPGVRW